jgi:hypothetical protein
MAIPQWHDLTQEEQQAIAELYTGFTSLLTARMAERLKALGLAEQKVGGTAGGTGLTEQGRKLFESCTRRRRPPARPPRNGPMTRRPKRERRGLITKKPRIVVRGSPAFLTDRARGKWAAGCLPNAAGVSWFLSSKSGARPRCAAISAPQMPLAEDQNTATGLQALSTTST